MAMSYTTDDTMADRAPSEERKTSRFLSDIGIYSLRIVQAS